MTKNSWDFSLQLKIGDRGEELFLEHYPKKIAIYPGREYDFTVNRTGQSIELKTDTYNMDKTDNFFFERFSDISRETPGGPWRALEDKVDIFCYYFVRHNLWYQFENLPALIKKLNKIVEKKGLVYIKNKGWVTGGYKVNRDDLEELYDVYEF